MKKLFEVIRNFRFSHIFTFAMAELLHILKLWNLSTLKNLFLVQPASRMNEYNLNEFYSAYKSLFFIAIVKNDNYIVHD
jgi:hypothetical protein